MRELKTEVEILISQTRKKTRDCHKQTRTLTENSRKRQKGQEIKKLPKKPQMKNKSWSRLPKKSPRTNRSTTNKTSRTLTLNQTPTNHHPTRRFELPGHPPTPDDVDQPDSGESVGSNNPGCKKLNHSQQGWDWGQYSDPTSQYKRPKQQKDKSGVSTTHREIT